mmetsp:Transcript_32954/g.78208  ORF Transcript_32954/g.78208 Transcript_32954/m.78208 type:complete len:268 (-) Transcript_32954:3427-4230(-)
MLTPNARAFLRKGSSLSPDASADCWEWRFSFRKRPPFRSVSSAARTTVCERSSRDHLRSSPSRQSSTADPQWRPSPRSIGERSPLLHELESCMDAPAGPTRISSARRKRRALATCRKATAPPRGSPSAEAASAEGPAHCTAASSKLFSHFGRTLKGSAPSQNCFAAWSHRRAAESVHGAAPRLEPSRSTPPDIWPKIASRGFAGAPSSGAAPRARPEAALGNTPNIGAPCMNCCLPDSCSALSASCTTMTQLPSSARPCSSSWRSAL